MRKTTITSYYDTEQFEKLKRLIDNENISQSKALRLALDLFFACVESVGIKTTIQLAEKKQVFKSKPEE